MVDSTIESVTIPTTNNYCGLRFWELKCVRKDGNFNRFNLKVSTMKEKGIAKTLNSKRKVFDWLNSEEGLSWINDRKDRCISTPLGFFL